MKSDTARKHFGPAGTPQVAIVGGGFAGIATAVKLKKAGINTFTVFEKSEGPGGTWWDNRYPGAEVDVASHLYSYSFKSHDWTRTHAKQAELQAYLEEVLDDFDLRPHFRFSTTVRDAVWDEHTHTYTVNLENGESVQANMVVSALGLLNYPKYPELARPRRLHRAQVPYLPLGARARPDRQAGGPRRNRLDGEPGRARDRSAG